ncbi:MAG: zinc ribbon domain-containing protein [Deltaproteobacteria bacterium]|nr:zinc ribbon domain-containing protein [Deltaproteobacteria bacterium]
MPFYEYECTKCKHRVEVFQKISDKPITRCEICNGRMKKLISQSSFQLKGSGWYVTDYASKSGGYDGKTPPKEVSGGSDAAKEVKAAETKPKIEASGSAGKKAKAKDE